MKCLYVAPIFWVGEDGGFKNTAGEPTTKAALLMVKVFDLPLEVVQLTPTIGIKGRTFRVKSRRWNMQHEWLELLSEQCFCTDKTFVETEMQLTQSGWRAITMTELEDVTPEELAWLRFADEEDERAQDLVGAAEDDLDAEDELDAEEPEPRAPGGEDKRHELKRTAMELLRTTFSSLATVLHIFQQDLDRDPPPVQLMREEPTDEEVLAEIAAREREGHYDNADDDIEAQPFVTVPISAELAELLKTAEVSDGAVVIDRAATFKQAIDDAMIDDHSGVAARAGADS